MSSHLKEPKASLLSVGVDGLFLLFLFGFGLFLFGNYVFYEYLVTGYDDWIYHGYKVTSILEQGLSSWDHIWANGMNHWKLYQYIPHYLAAQISTIFQVPVSRAMIFETVGILMFHLATTYILLKKLHIKSLPAVLAITAFLTMPQYWAPVKEFSILFPFTMISIYIYLWVQDFQQRRHSYLLPALAGIAWLFHPTLAYITAGLWLFTFPLQFTVPNIKLFLPRFFLYLLISSVFWLPYVTKGYYFGNPFFSSPQFYKENLPGDYYGFGLLMFSLLGLSWAGVLAMPRQIPKWSKILLVFITLFVVAIRLGQSGALPSAILQLQFARAVPLLGVLLTFVIASIATVVWPKHSRFLKTVGVVFFAFVCSAAIGNASRYAPSATNTLESPAATFVKQHGIPKGKIFTQDIGYASFLSPQGTQFVNSYFEHMLPSPSAMRFGGLLRNDISYTGISQQQVDYLIAYSHVLGVQYLFLPRLSPSIPLLTHASQEGKGFKIVPFETNSGLIVLESVQPISTAYAVIDESVLSTKDLKKPTMHATSWTPWDQRFVALNKAIEEKKLVPITMRTVDTDRLEVELANVPDHISKVLLIQSFDSHWEIAQDGYSLTPTSERLTVLNLPSSNRHPVIHLKNSWPSWHWPHQIAMMGLVLFIIGMETAHRMTKSRRKSAPTTAIPAKDPIFRSLVPTSTLPSVVQVPNR